MQRKLNDEDVPTAVEPADGISSSSQFASLGLESRLLQAIAKENFSAPTTVQSKAIPLALAGKDILARSKTGSGKTAAYVLPILQSILQKKNVPNFNKATSALVLVPTKELALQVYRAISAFSTYCAKDVRTINLTLKDPEAVERTLLADSPDIVVATPARAAQNLNVATLTLENLSHLVIDEADLVLSYGYSDDLHTIAKAVPKGVQTFLMSATLTTEVDTLKGLFCRDPVILELQESASEEGGITQYAVKCAEDEKFLLAYVIFKLKLIKGKCIIFVGDIGRCYRLKLFFEQFGIRSCVLNSELPINSRVHVVEEFNKNIYEIIIAADEHEVFGEGDSSSWSTDSADVGQEVSNGPEDDAIRIDARQSAQAGGTSHDPEIPEKEEISNPPQKRRKKSKKDKEYGISRGIDFRNVACVLNFDLPASSRSYTHRIGRTGRAGKTGMALSFVVPSELYHKHKSTTIPSAEYDEETIEKITRHQQKKGREVKPYHFDMKQVDAFRYRMNDALRAVTRLAIRQARTRELRQELLKSEKLKRHFEENPEDLHHLRHDGELRAARIQPHLKHVPEYLMPSNGNKGVAGEDIGFVGLRKTTDNRIRKARMQKRMMGKGKKPVDRKSDPLKTFDAKRRR